MAFNIGKSLMGMQDANKKKDYVKHERGWDAEDKGAGAVPKKDNDMFVCGCGNRGGVDMPAPINFGFGISGVGKPK